MNADLKSAFFAEHDEGQAHFILVDTSDTKYLKSGLENLSGSFSVLQIKERLLSLKHRNINLKYSRNMEFGQLHSAWQILYSEGVHTGISAETGLMVLPMQA